MSETMSAQPVALATYNKRTIIVYNDDGTINLWLTRHAGHHIAEATHKLLTLVPSFSLPPDVQVTVAVQNVYCSPEDNVVFWDGLVVQQGDSCLLRVQFAYKASQNPCCFPVKGTELTTNVHHFGRSWARASRYISEIFERLHRGYAVRL